MWTRLWQCSERTGRLLVCGVLLLSLAACGGGDTSKTCVHDWQAATCTAPVTCSKCGATQGEPLGHTYSGTSCTGTDVCAVCGAVIPAKGHQWIEATCTEPKTCAQCGATEGEPRGHTYVNGTCSVCGDQIWTPLERSGTGDAALDDITIGADFYSVHFTHTGSGTFQVKMKDATETEALLVETKDNYDGTVLVYGASPLHLDIQAGGDWSYKIDKVGVTETSAQLSGHGDTVIQAAPWKSGTWHITHGDGGAVYVYGFNGRTVIPILEPKTGGFDGDVTVTLPETGNTVLEIHASGDWTITPAA